jgi:hypothetical protein
MQFIKRAVSKCKPKFTIPITTGLGLYYLYTHHLPPPKKKVLKERYTYPVLAYVTRKKKQVDTFVENKDESFIKEAIIFVGNVIAITLTIKFSSSLFKHITVPFTSSDKECPVNMYLKQLPTFLK